MVEIIEPRVEQDGATALPAVSRPHCFWCQRSCAVSIAKLQPITNPSLNDQQGTKYRCILRLSSPEITANYRGLYIIPGLKQAKHQLPRP